ncbi:MAG: hypothetical protein ACK5P6_07765 [Pseudobdellovibrionaceae bacterium]|jgi:hypothetical protein
MVPLDFCPLRQINSSWAKDSSRILVIAANLVTLDSRLEMLCKSSRTLKELPIAILMNHPRRYLQNCFLFVLGFFAAGCVSVSIAPSPVTKSKDFSFQVPATPFAKLEGESFDHSWQSEKTGNTIAILSECGVGGDLPLVTIESESLSSLTHKNIVETKHLTFAQREARRTRAQGQLDGVSVEIEILTVKKNSCSFVVTYVGRQKSFPLELKIFESFLQNLEIR